MKGKDLINYIIENNFFDREFNITTKDLDKEFKLNKKVMLYNIEGDVVLIGTLIEDDGVFYTITSKSHPEGHCYNKE